MGLLKSVEIQCNLLNAPPLKKLSAAGGSLDDSFITETDTDLENDFDTSFKSSQEEDSQDEYTTE